MPHPNQLWFLETSTPHENTHLSQSYRKESPRVYTGSPRTPANRDSEKHYFLINSHASRHAKLHP